MIVYKLNDKLVSRTDFEAVFGPNVKVQGDGKWRVTVLNGRTGDQPASLIVTCLDKNGKPKPNVTIAWWWPDVKYEDNALESGGLGLAQRGYTNTNGQLGLAMGGKTVTKDRRTGERTVNLGAYYDPPNGGPHALWVSKDPIMGNQSQVVTGLGMVGGENHWHVDVTMQEDAAEAPEPEPPPEPEPEPTPPDGDDGLQAVIDDLTTAISHVQAAYTKTKEARSKVQALLGD